MDLTSLVLKLKVHVEEQLSNQSCDYAAAIRTVIMRTLRYLNCSDSEIIYSSCVDLTSSALQLKINVEKHHRIRTLINWSLLNYKLMKQFLENQQFAE